MARLRFRDRFFTPPVGRALSSPWSILLFGASTAVAIVLGAPVVVAGAIGAAAYAGKVAFAMPRSQKPERIDPFTLKEPWRTYVQGAQSAKLRFDRTVDGTRPGPLRDRLAELSSRLGEGIEESWRIACRGNDIDGALSQLDTRQAEVELDQLKAQAANQGGSADLESTIESLEAQISSANRMKKVSASTRDRLRLLDARFDELVARAVEVSVGSGDSLGLGNDVDDLVTELESLRLAIDDTDRAERGELPPTPADASQTEPPTHPSTQLQPPAAQPAPPRSHPSGQTQPKPSSRPQE
jgi:hypothetical protein